MVAAAVIPLEAASLSLPSPRAARAAVRVGPGPLLAWRVWRIENSGGWRLCSLRGEPWLPGQAALAQCVDHPAPALDCGCGVWAWRWQSAAERWATLEAVLEWLGGVDLLAVGTVAVWGRVVASGDTLRTQYALPSSVSVLASDKRRAEDAAREVAAAYRVRCNVCILRRRESSGWEFSGCW